MRVLGFSTSTQHFGHRQLVVCVCVIIIFLNHSFETMESMCLQKWRTKKWNKEETTPNYGRLSSSSFITANRDRKLATNKQKGNI